MACGVRRWESPTRLLNLQEVNAILASVGAESDSDKLTAFLGSLAGKDFTEVLAAGRAKMASMPSGGGGGGGGGGAAAAPAAAAGGGGGGAAAAEKKKEPEPEEEEEDMGFDLFVSSPPTHLVNMFCCCRTVPGHVPDP